MRFLFSTLFLLLTTSASEGMLLTIGPMLHYNWGSGGQGLSFGLEASWWTQTDLPKPGFSEKGENALAGFDLGVEVQGSKTRVYTEAQYGIIVPSGYTGASIGPYLELEERDFGLQGSLWSALLVGADLRARVGTSGAAFSPGLFAKLGICEGDCGP